MVTSRSVGLQTLLVECTEPLLERWFAGLTELAVEPLEEEPSRKLWHQLIGWLSTEPAPRDQALAMGAELADLYRGELAVLSLAQDVLLRQVMEGLGDVYGPAVSPRVAVLCGALAEGFVSHVGGRARYRERLRRQRLFGSWSQAERSWRESEQRYRKLLEALPVGVAVHRDGRLIYLNRAGASMLGAEDPSTLLGRSVAEFVHQASQSQIRDRIRQLMEGQSSVPYLLERFLRPDGSSFEVEVAASYIEDRGRPAVQVVFRDISDRQKAEAALRQSEHLFRTLAETTNAAIFMYQDEGNIYVNAATQHITGYSEDDLLAMPFWGLIRPDYQELVKQRGMDRLGGEAVPSQYEIPILTQTGETRWLSYSGSRISLKGKSTVLGTAFDITEQRRIQAALTESELKFRTLAETTAASIIIFRDGRIVYANRSAEVLLGYTSDEIVKLDIWQIIPEDQTVVVNRAVANAQADLLCPVRFAHQIITKQMAKRWVEVTLARIEYQGEPGWITTSFDITERVEAEASLRKYSQRLELLSEVDRASLTGRPVKEVARQALPLLQELIKFQAASIVEVDAEAEELVLLSVHPAEDGALAEGNRFYFSQWTDLSDRMAGQALYVSDIGILESATPLQRILVERGIRSYFSVPLIAQGTLIGLLNVGADRPEAFSQDDRAIVAEVAARLTVAVQNARLFSEVMAGRKRLEELSLRLVQVQETERRYLARELHDEIAQTLTALRIDLEMVEEQSEAKSSKSLEQATALVQDLFIRVRDLSLDLRPPMLDDLGLLPTYLWYFDRFRSQYGISVHFDHWGMSGRLDPEVELVAYRIVQEALTNVARHAHADQVWVHLWVGAGKLNVQIEDRGQGFDARAVLQRHATSGLSGMVERARLVGGQFSIESERDKGTCLTVVLPISLAVDDSLEGRAHDSHTAG